MILTEAFMHYYQIKNGKTYTLINKGQQRTTVDIFNLIET